MSLVKLALDFQNNPIIVVNHHDDGSQSKGINKRNVGAAIAGGTLGFGAKELVEQGHKLSPKIKVYDKLKMSHRYASRMAAVGGGLLGAGAAFSYLKRHGQNQSPDMYMY